MLKKLLIVLALLVVAVLGFVGYAMTRPAEYHVERSITIQAPPDRVFAELADFTEFAKWSPWEKLDPGMKKQIEGPPATVGSSYFWSGNDKVGEGRMTFTSLTPNERVDVKLEFIKPFASVCQTAWVLKPDGANTTVTWQMDGKNEAVMEKVFAALCNMDKLVGADFERGLSQLKGLAEKPTP